MYASCQSQHYDKIHVPSTWCFQEDLKPINVIHHDIDDDDEDDVEDNKGKFTEKKNDSVNCGDM